MARWLRALGLFLATSCLASLALAQQSAERSFALSKDPIVLRGIHPQFSSYLRFGEPAYRTAEPVLQFTSFASSGLNLRKSTLTISRGKVPLKTVFLEPGEQQVSLALGEVPGGYQELSLSGRLSLNEETCGEDLSEAAWLRIENAEVVVSRRPPLLKKATVASQLRAMAESPSFNLLPPVLENETTRLAVLRLSSSLQREGLSWDPQSAFVFELEIDPESDQPRLVARENGLSLLASTARGLLTGVGAVFDERLFLACPERQCLLSTKAPSLEEEQAQVSRAKLEVPVLPENLRRGWTVEGPGRESLEFLFRPETSWEITDSPRLLLRLFLPSVFSEEKGWARVSVRLNETKLDTWILEGTDLESSQEQLLSVALPPVLASEKLWSFRVDVEMKVAEGAPCSGAGSSGFWIRLEPTTALKIPRKENLRSGLAGFLEGQKTLPPVHLPEKISWPHLLRFSELLQPLAERFPNSKWRSHPNCDDCVVLVSLSDSSVPLELQERSSIPYWQDRKALTGLPEMRAADTALVFMDSGSLKMALGPGSGPSALSDWSRLDSLGGVTASEEWIRWGNPEVREVREVANSAGTERAPLESSSERSFFWVNVFTLAALSLILAAAAWLSRREKLNEA